MTMLNQKRGENKLKNQRGQPPPQPGVFPGLAHLVRTALLTARSIHKVNSFSTRNGFQTQRKSHISKEAKG